MNRDFGDYKNNLDKYKRLIKKLKWIESRSWFNIFENFLRVSDSEKETSRKEWDKYYREVTKTPIYEIVQKQKIALSKKDYRQVKLLNERARQLAKNGKLITLIKPNCINPYIYEHDPLLNSYLQIKSDIAQLENQYGFNSNEDAEKDDFWEED